MTHLYQAICLSLTMGFITQGTQAAALPKPTKSVQAPLVIEKQKNTLENEKQKSLIEKAITQQKFERAENRLLVKNEQIKVLTSISVTPTQNFFAEQNQRFSRLMQTIFPQDPS